MYLAKKLRGMVREEAGLTLLELLVVAAILALLAALTAVGVTGTTTTTRGTTKINDISEVEKAKDSYSGAHPSTLYPTFHRDSSGKFGLLPASGLYYAINWDATFLSTDDPPVSKTFVARDNGFLPVTPKHARQIVTSAGDVNTSFDSTLYKASPKLLDPVDVAGTSTANKFPGVYIDAGAATVRTTAGLPIALTDPLTGAAVSTNLDAIAVWRLDSTSKVHVFLNDFAY